MKLSYVSDLHLEFRDYPDFSKEEGGDILLLVGDIVTASLLHEKRTDGDARKLQKYLTGKFKTELLDKYNKVYMVMGNHEHYHNVYSNTLVALRAGFNRLGLNIQILENKFVPLRDDLYLLGATLWTDYFKGNPISMMACEQGMNDYRFIAKDFGDYYTSFDPRTMTAECLLNIHNNTLSYFKEILRIYSDKNFIIMTHHAPTLISLNKEHVGNGLDGAYASDLSEFILDHTNIKYYIHGHTHMNVDYSVGDHTKVLANQRGYNTEKSWESFNGLKHIEV